MAIVSDRLQEYQKSVDEIHQQIEVSHFLTTRKKEKRVSYLY